MSIELFAVTLHGLVTCYLLSRILQRLNRLPPREVGKMANGDVLYERD